MHTVMIRFAIVVMFWLGSSAAAVSAKVKLLDGSSGLSSNIVTSIIKDKRGLMWIGTRNGLNIYAGYSFSRPYPELNNQYITHLSYDSVWNAVWVGTLRGLYVVQPDNGSVQYVLPDTTWGDNAVTALCVIPGDAAYVAYRSGVLVRVDHHYNIRRITDFSESKQRITEILPAGGHTLMFPDPNENGAIAALDLSTMQVTSFSLPGNIAFQHSKVYGDTLLAVNSGTKEMRFLHMKTRVDVTPEILSGRKVEMLTLHGDRLLIVTCGSYCSNYYAPDTLLEYNMSTGELSDITGTPEIFIGRQKYYSGYRDAEGITWLGTSQGLFKIQPNQHLFDTVLFNDKFRISTRTIIEEPDGDLYVGSSYGLYYYSAASASWEWYRYVDPETRQSAVLITDMLDHPDYIYIVGYGTNVFYRFDKRNKRFDTDLYRKEKKLSAYSLFRDEDSLIWIGTRSGLIYYDPVTGSWGDHWKDILDIGGCPVFDIKSSADDEKIWLATKCGVYFFHKTEGVLAHYHKNSVPALSSNEVYFAEEDDQGYLWVGTNGGGVNVISPDGKEIRYLNREENGLSSNIVYGMLRQENGNRWFSTSKGLSCYNPVKGKFFNYYTIDGLCDDDLNYNSYLKGHDGRMYFGSINGISAFYPEEIERAGRGSQDVRLFVLPVSKWDEQTKTFSMINNFRGEGDEIVLHSPSASLVFNLGLTDYTDPIHNVFTYRIVGLFDDWIPLSGEPVLRLHGIPYGRYTVQVRGMAMCGVAASNQLHFSIHVKKPFYNTVWFYVLIATVAVTLLFLFFLLKYRTLKELQLMRLQISSNLHDEVGSLLTSITLFSDNLRFSGNTGPEKDARLEKIAALSREATVTMGDILWAVDARNDMPGSLSERIREYAEDLLLPMQVDLKVNVEDAHPRQKMPIELRQQLYLIFKEAVNNVVKHAAVTHVEITLRYHNENEFLFRVVNDGATLSGQGVKGQGLKNIRMRAKKIGADMYHEAENDTFRLTVQKRRVT